MIGEIKMLNNVFPRIYLIVIIFMLVFFSQTSVANQNPLSVEWVATGGGLGSDNTRIICLDSLGYIYIVGTFNNTFTAGNIKISSQGMTDAFIAKLNPNGEFIWLQQLKSNGDVSFSRVASDGFNYIYVNGKISANASIDGHQLDRGNGRTNPILLKLNLDGKLIWGHSFYFSGTNQCHTNGLSIDENHNIYITGYLDRGSIIFNNGISLSTNDNRTGTFVAKFDSNGICQWANPIYDYDGVMYNHNVEVFKNDVFISGEFTRGISFNKNATYISKGEADVFLAKYSTDGMYIWSKVFGSNEQDNDTGLDIDNNGNIILCGYTKSKSLMFDDKIVNSTGEFNGYVVKVDNIGNCLWANTFRSDKFCTTQWTGHDMENNIYSTSYITSKSTINNDTIYYNGKGGSVLSKFSPDGELLWNYLIYGSGSVHLQNPILEKEHTIYLCGGFQNTLFVEGHDTINSLGESDIFVMKLSTESCDETAFNYNSFKQINNLNLIKDARLSDSTITLTPADYWKRGAVWHTGKIPVKKGFTTEFSFRISDGENRFSEEEYSGADGIAFVIQNNSDIAIGRKGGSIGFAGIPNSLAVEFDTYYNNDDDSQYEDFNDPNENHIAVFCNGTEPNSCDHSSKAHLASTAMMPIIPDGRIYYSKIEYDYKQKELKIYLDSTAEINSAPVLLLSDIDLSQMIDLDSKEYAWLGFTSSTGNAFEQHELLSWSICPIPTSTILTDIQEKDLVESGIDNLIIYPNPVKDILNIVTNKTGRIKLINNLGQIILKRDINTIGLHSFSTSSISNGIYYIIFRTSDGIIIKKVAIV